VALGGGRARLLAADRHGSRVLQRALDAGCDELRARVAEELLLPPDVEEEAAGGGSGGDFYGSESEEEGAWSGDNDPAASSSRRPRPPAKAHRPGAVLLATHPFGCRVLQRILALSPPCEEEEAAEEEAEASSPAAAPREFRALAARARRQVVLAAPRLATDEYANYVLQKLLRGGSSSSSSRASPSPSPSAPPAAAGEEKPAPALLSAADRHAVARGLLGRARELATHVSGSNVLEAVLASCGRGERRALLAELLSPDRDGGGGERGAATAAAAKERTDWSLEGAMAHPYGNYVFQRALLVCDDADQRELLSLAVAAAEPRLRGSPHGRHLLARVGVVAAASSASPAPVAAEAEGAAAVAREEEHDGTKEDVAPIPAAAVAAAGKAPKTAAAEKAATTTKPSAPVSYSAAAAAATIHSQARVPLVATARAQQQQC
jgi:hypothetical protein